MNELSAVPMADQDAVVAGEGGEPVYFAVSVNKLLFMTLCTLGLYEIWWFYWNWKLIKERERSDISPVARAIFSIFFVYDLCKRINGSAGQAGKTQVSAGFQAAGWIVLSLTWRLPDPYAMASLLAVLFLLPIQQLANQVNQRAAPAHDPNAGYSGWNIAALVIGGLMLVLVIIGAFFSA